MKRTTYFQLKRNLNPREWAAGIVKWRSEHTDRVREATKLRVRRFRARRK